MSFFAIFVKLKDVTTSKAFKVSPEGEGGNWLRPYHREPTCMAQQSVCV